MQNSFLISQYLCLMLRQYNLINSFIGSGEVSRHSDPDSLPPVLFAQDLSQLKHRLDLEDVIRLRPELTEAEYPHLTSTSILVSTDVLEVCRIIGREHLDTALSHAPRLPAPPPQGHS